MGKGGYLGGSTIIRTWGGHASRAKSGVGAIDLNAHLNKPKKAKAGAKKKKRSSSRTAQGNGLTIGEQVARARKKVRSIEAEISRTKHQLLKLERQLVDARKQLEKAETLPRRSALGQALAKALNPQQQS